MVEMNRMKRMTGNEDSVLVKERSVVYPGQQISRGQLEIRGLTVRVYIQQPLQSKWQPQLASTSLKKRSICERREEEWREKRSKELELAVMQSAAGCNGPVWGQWMRNVDWLVEERRKGPKNTASNAPYYKTCTQTGLGRCHMPMMAVTRELADTLAIY